MGKARRSTSSLPFVVAPHSRETARLHDSACVHLSQVDLDILSLMAEGYTAAAMGRRIHLSISTIKNRTVIMGHQFGLNGVNLKTRLVVLAIREGWIKIK